jgi:tetratricopeptide (TPR) repeat protein
VDERKKQIERLKKISQECRDSLDSLMEKLGGELFGRISRNETGFNDIDRYFNLQAESARYSADIALVEEQIIRFKELEERIEYKERDEKERSKELVHCYSRLGKALMESGRYGEFTSSYRAQAEVLDSKVDSLEQRLSGLDKKEGGNVFSWIGKGAQGLVLRSFLTRTQESLDQIYRSVGERFCRQESGDGGHSGEVAAVFAEIEEIREATLRIGEELVQLRGDKRKITESFGPEGNPLKQIKSLKNRIDQVKEQLNVLYLKMGKEAASIEEAEVPSDRKEFVDSLLVEADREVLDKAAGLKKTIKSNEVEIAKLEASLAIDKEKDKIEKYRYTISEKRNKISEVERAIEDLEESIKESEETIVELKKILDE